MSVTNFPGTAETHEPEPAELSVTFPDEWAGLEPPPRRWVVEGMIPATKVTLFSGDGGLGKSLLCQQLQTATALGNAWLGAATKPCRTLGIYCEDEAEELQRRQQAILGDLGRDHEDLDLHMAVVSRAGHDNTLATPGDNGMLPTTFYNQVKTTVANLGAELVILDPSVDLYGGDENDRHQVRSFVQLLARMAQETGAAVLLTAHPSKSAKASGEGFSGSTDWNNSVRSRLYLTAAGEDDQADRIVTTPKANYGPNDGRIELIWRDGVFVPARDPSGGDAVDRMAANARDREVRETFLKALRKACDQGMNLSDNAHAGTYAPRVIKRMPDASGMSAKALERAMFTLLETGDIRFQDYGRPSRPKRRLVVAGKPENSTEDA